MTPAHAGAAPIAELMGNAKLVDLSPSMACARQDELGAELVKLDEAGADSFHFDLMDGHFVPNLGFSVDMIAALRPLSKRPFHVHLMVEQPDEYVETLAKAGCDLFIFHIEACRYPRRLISRIQACGMKAGISINPATPISFLESVRSIEFVQLMTVEPGFVGQAWLPTSPARAEAITSLCGPDVVIAADGNINQTTAPLLAMAGASVFICGTSSLFRGGSTVADYAAALTALRTSITNPSRPTHA